MPLDVARLRDSDLAALETPEACWAAVLLWCASWHQVPAASLPDDDRVLSKIAGYGRVLKEWMQVRAGALRGWIKCSDGRLYHPVVAEKAIESWKAKALHHWKKECDRIRKSNKQREQEGKPALPFPSEPIFETVGIPTEAKQIPSEKKEIPTESKTDSAGNEDQGDGIPLENALKGQGEGEGQGQGEFKNKDHLSGTTSADDQTETDTSERKIPKRNVQIAILLRAKGVKPLTSMHPEALAWAENPACTDEILTAAVESARQYKGETADINPNYLKPIIEQLLTKPPDKPPKQQQDAWWLTNAGIERKGKELGMFARGTESYNDFKDRIFAKLREGGKAA